MSANRRLTVKENSLLFVSYHKNRHRRVIGAVVIFSSDHQVFSGIQLLQPCKEGISFFESGVSSAVDTQHKDSAFFQKGKGSFKSCDTGSRSGCQLMISSWQIAEVKYNAAYCFRSSIISHVFVGIQKQLIIIGSGFFF